MENLASRLSMLLGTTEVLSICGSREFTNICSNEFVISSILIPRDCVAVKSTYGFSERLIAREMDRPISLHNFIQEHESAEEEREDISLI